MLIICGLFFPLLCEFGERHYLKTQTINIETVQTSKNISANLQDVWNQIHFYEDSNSYSSWLTLAGFPRPIGTSGFIKEVGAKTKCIYEGGFIDKTITAVDIDKKTARFEFDVINQVNVEDHAIKLIDGGFYLTQQDTQKTSLTLKTTYKPLMTPRFIWRPFEKATNQALHMHIIKEIEHQIKQPSRIKMRLSTNQ